MFCIGSILVQDVSHFEPAVCHGWGGWTIPSNNTEMNFRFPPIGKTSTLTARCSAKCLEKVLKYSVDVDESHGKKGKHKEFILKKKNTIQKSDRITVTKTICSAQNQPYFQKKVRKKTVGKSARPHFKPPRWCLWKRSSSLLGFFNKVGRASRTATCVPLWSFQ